MQERSQETRRRIQHAAVKLFAENGYEASGVAEICALSAASKGSFYHHFPEQAGSLSRAAEGLAHGHRCGAGRGAPVRGECPRRSRRDGAPDEDRFQRGGRERPAFPRVLAAGPPRPRGVEGVHRTVPPVPAVLREDHPRGVDEGSLPPVDAKVAGQALVALAVGILVQDVLDPKGGPWDQVAVDAVQMLVSGIRTGQGASVPRRR